MAGPFSTRERVVSALLLVSSCKAGDVNVGVGLLEGLVDDLLTIMPAEQAALVADPEIGALLGRAYALAADVLPELTDRERHERELNALDQELEAAR